MGAAKVASEILTLQIQMESGPDKLGALSFHLATIRIGRGPENDVVLALDPKVSRLHAEIQQHGNDFFLVNLSTKNFILLNGHRIEKEKLSPGDTVQIGDSTLKVQFQIDKPAVIDNSNFEESPAANQNLAPVDFSNVAKPSRVRLPTQPAAGNQNVAKAHPAAQPVQQVPNFVAPQFETPPYQPGPSPQPQVFKQKDNGKMKFYVILGVVGLVLYLLLSDSGTEPKKDPNAVRTPIDLTKQIEQSELAITQLKSESEKQNSITYRRAQENLVRALRDFNQGQYSRAMEGFQVVLNLDPNNEMALRYRNLSATRLDQQVSEMMIQGARYLEKGNFRLCADAYGKAMILLQGRRDDPKYIQSRKFQEQCRLSQGGRF